MPATQLKRIRNAVALRVQEEAEQFDDDNEKPPTGHRELIEAKQLIEANEIGDTRIYIQENRGRFIFDHAEQVWYRWEDHFWALDKINEALAVCDRIVDHYLSLENSIHDRIREDLRAGRETKTAKDLEKLIHKRIKDLQTLSRRQHILKLATAGSNTLGISGENWDSDSLLLGCQNGVIELDSGRFRPGAPEDFIRTITSTRWEDLHAEAPIWEQFLLDIFDGNQEIVSYIQRLFGMAISGENRERIFPILYGVGRNGKSTLFEAIAHTLGSIAGPVQAEMLLRQKFTRASSGPSPDIMALKGRRIVWASETGEGRQFDVGKIKQLTGGDSLTGRFLYGKRDEVFRPTHTLFLLTNFKPEAPAHDYAFWQRAQLISLPLSFVDHPIEPNERRREPNLLNRLKQETPGILAWLVRGLLSFRMEGLNPPNIISDATRDFQCEVDIIGQFINECCLVEREAREQAGALQRRYRIWCEENGYRPVSPQAFSNYLRTRFQRDAGRHRWYRGISLRVEL